MKFIKNKALALLLIFAFLLTQNLMAQRGRHHHPKMKGMTEELKTELNLTAEQTAQIEKLETAFKAQLETLKADDSKERSEKRTEMKSLMENQKAAVEKILTAEQKTLLAEKKAERKEQWKARKEEHKTARKELKSEMETYRAENVEPVLKGQRAKLESAISAEDKATITALRLAFAEKKAARKAEMQKHKAEKKDNRGKRSAADKEARMKARKEHHAARENDEDFKTLKALVEKYEKDIDALYAEIEPQQTKWKEDQKAIKQKFHQEKGERAEERGRSSKGEGEHKGRRGKHGKRGDRKARAGKMKKGHFLLLDPNAIAPTTAKQAMTEISVFPNPATTTNNLKYSVKEAGSVKIEIHDAQGRLVRTLLDGEKTKGEYQIEVNISDLKNRVYYYVVSDKQGITTKKIIIATK